MKTREKAMEEWITDEIVFYSGEVDMDGVATTQKFSRKDFERLCETMNQHVTVQNAGWFMDLLRGNFTLEELFKQWTTRFFHPSNLVRYESKREVADAFVQRLERIRDAIVVTGDFSNIPVESPI